MALEDIVQKDKKAFKKSRFRAFAWGIASFLGIPTLGGAVAGSVVGGLIGLGIDALVGTLYMGTPMTAAAGAVVGAYVGSAAGFVYGVYKTIKHTVDAVCSYDRIKTAEEVPSPQNYTPAAAVSYSAPT